MKALCVVLGLLACGDLLAQDSVEQRLFACSVIESSDERLECYDMLTPQPGRHQEPDDDPVLAALDRNIANSLIDPMSVISYRVSGAVRCELINRRLKGKFEECVCFFLNAKNRLGGYTGDKLSYSTINRVGDQIVAIGFTEVDSKKGLEACFDAGMTDRDADLIRAHVR